MDTITVKDFQKLDIRIGTVVEADVPKWSHWVMRMKVDFASETKSSKDRSSRRVRTEPKSQEARFGGGEEIGERTIFAGIMHFYKPEDLTGKQFPFIVNLEPKKIGPEGDFSQGMMLMAVASKKEMGLKPIKVEDEEVDEYPILFMLPKKVPNGTRVM